jgi:hypothetical protein
LDPLGRKAHLGAKMSTTATMMMWKAHLDAKMSTTTTMMMWKAPKIDVHHPHRDDAS